MMGRVLLEPDETDELTSAQSPLPSVRVGSGTHSSSTPACQISLPITRSISSSSFSPSVSSSSGSSRLGRKVEAPRKVVRVLDERVLKKLEDEAEGDEKGESLERRVREEEEGEGEEGVDMVGGRRCGCGEGGREG